MIVQIAQFTPTFRAERQNRSPQRCELRQIGGFSSTFCHPPLYSPNNASYAEAGHEIIGFSAV